jgi:hypothetical protein
VLPATTLRHAYVLPHTRDPRAPRYVSAVAGPELKFGA